MAFSPSILVSFAFYVIVVKALAENSHLTSLQRCKLDKRLFSAKRMLGFMSIIKYVFDRQSYLYEEENIK